MNTYKTAEIAKIIGIHPNTVRLYEELRLIPKPERRPNGYRVFTEFHIAQFRLAFQVEVLQNGLRKKMIRIVKRSAAGDFNTALSLTQEYITQQNWEMNGLLSVRRKQNRYRVYSVQELRRLKIIRALRCKAQEAAQQL